MTTDPLLAESAAELYRLVTGADLGAERFAEMLATESDGKWSSRVFQYADGQQLEARALFGLFVLGEDVIWSAVRHVRVTEVFRRMATLVTESDMLRGEVDRVDRARGEERIELKSGRRLLFGCRNHGRGFRGYSVDCHLLDECFSDGYDSLPLALINGSGRPNPQVVIGP